MCFDKIRVFVFGDEERLAAGERDLGFAIGFDAGEVHQIALVDAEELLPQLLFQGPDFGVAGKFPAVQVEHHLVVAALDIADAAEGDGAGGAGGLQGEGSALFLP